ncbi:MAG: protein kinase, partial [Verrucomicrobiae bacterium]|nr:protein kinase [Verrucomicrobiae bacterium]NNJ86669.1 protein kinase [Akkermansiaceae bacterium]
MDPTPEQTHFEAPAIEELQPNFPAYEIEDFIAQGGMGAVYKARQISLDRSVAIKILPREFGEDPTFRKSFEAEAKAMARLNHPNLIGVYDFGEVDGMLFLIMEFVHGKSLFHSSHGIAIDPTQAAEIILSI